MLMFRKPTVPKPQLPLSAIRLLTADAGGHVVIQTYFGVGALVDVVEACISAAKAAGKPVMLKDELGVEIWFHWGSITEERIIYMQKQRAAQIAAMSIWTRVLRRIGIKSYVGIK